MSDSEKVPLLSDLVPLESEYSDIMMTSDESQLVLETKTVVASAPAKIEVEKKIEKPPVGNVNGNKGANKNNKPHAAEKPSSNEKKQTVNSTQKGKTHAKKGGKWTKKDPGKLVQQGLTDSLQKAQGEIDALTKKSQCFECGEEGHKKRDCKKKKTPMIVINTGDNSNLEIKEQEQLEVPENRSFEEDVSVGPIKLVDLSQRLQNYYLPRILIAGILVFVLWRIWPLLSELVEWLEKPDDWAEEVLNITKRNVIDQTTSYLKTTGSVLKVGLAKLIHWLHEIWIFVLIKIFLYLSLYLIKVEKIMSYSVVVPVVQDYLNQAPPSKTLDLRYVLNSAGKIIKHKWNPLPITFKINYRVRTYFSEDYLYMDLPALSFMNWGKQINGVFSVTQFIEGTAPQLSCVMLSHDRKLLRDRIANFFRNFDHVNIPSDAFLSSNKKTGLVNSVLTMTSTPHNYTALAIYIYIMSNWSEFKDFLEDF